MSRPAVSPAEISERLGIWIDRAGLLVGTFLVALIVGVAIFNALPELPQ
jgi:hypothetical protein